jgi:hypothetical protein
MQTDTTVRVTHVLVVLAAITLSASTMLVAHLRQVEAVANVGVPCQTINTSIDPVPGGFGSPFDLFTAPPQLALRVQCAVDGTGTTAVAGSAGSDLYIYKDGYELVDNTWKPIAFSGDTAVGPWFVGTADASLSAIASTSDGVVVAYMCKLVGGAWKCGCRDQACATPLWQMQHYRTLDIASNATGGTAQNVATSTFSSSTQARIDQIEGMLSGSQLASLKKKAEDLNALYSKEVYDIYQASPQIVVPGDTLMISGYDLSTAPGGNVVLWNGVAQGAAVASSDGKTLTITVPQLSPGKYDLSVVRNGATTPHTTTVWVRDASLPQPHITSVTPTQGKLGDVFTIHGTGFTPTGNTVLTTFGKIENLSSTGGGTEISFTFDPFAERPVFRNFDGSLANYPWPIYVYVINTGGIASENGSFKVVM